MMGRWYPPPTPPAVHPTGRVSGGRGEALARRSQPPAGGADRDPAAAGQDDDAAGMRVSVAVVSRRPGGASSLPAREKCTLSDPGRLGSERRGPQLVGGLASYDPDGGRSG